MRVDLNGTPKDLREGETVASLIQSLGLSGRGGIAVEVNASVVPRSEHETTALREGDAVEVVTMLAGG